MADEIRINEPVSGTCTPLTGKVKGEFRTEATFLPQTANLKVVVRLLDSDFEPLVGPYEHGGHTPSSTWKPWEVEYTRSPNTNDVVVEAKLYSDSQVEPLATAYVLEVDVRDDCRILEDVDVEPIGPGPTVAAVTGVTNLIANRPIHRVLRGRCPNDTAADVRRAVAVVVQKYPTGSRQPIRVWSVVEGIFRGTKYAVIIPVPKSPPVDTGISYQCYILLFDANDRQIHRSKTVAIATG